MALVANVGLCGTGWVLGPIPLLSRRFDLYPPANYWAGASRALPDALSRQSIACPTLNQGQTSACVGAASSALSYLSAKISGLPLLGGAIPSPGLTFRGIKSRERSALLAPRESTIVPLPPLQNTGCSAGDALLWIGQEGLVSMRPGVTPDGRNFDLWCDDDLKGLTNPPPSNATQEVSLAELIGARKNLYVGEYYLPMASPNFITLLKAALLLAPVGWGGYVDSQYFSYTKGGKPFGPCNPNDPAKDGHFMAITGWRPSVLHDGTVDWETQGSWGQSFGDNGFAFATQDWAASGTDAYVWTMRSTA